MEAEAIVTGRAEGEPAGADPRPNPFVGPRSFARGETLFGRDREAEEIVDLLIAERIVLLYSPSGAGKTSLIQAKLVPMLEAEGFSVRPIVRVSQHPSEEEAAAGFANRYLFSTLRSLQGGEAAGPSPHLVAASTLDDFLTITAPKKAKGEAELIIFDQFEEILNVDRNAIGAKEEFFAQLGAALRDKTRWALFSMREDFVAALDPYLQRIPRRLATRYRLDLLGVDGAQRAILGPAEADGVRIDPEVVSRLVDDLRRVRVQDADGSIVEQLGPVVEPVQLQVVCYRSWDALTRGGPAPGATPSAGSRAATDLAVKDVDEALADYYAEKVAHVVARLGIPERTVRDWCEAQLITAHGFRGQVLREVPTTQGLANEAIAGLIDAHLVRSDDHHGGTWYELAHDRLIDPIRANNAAWRDRHLDQFQMFAANWARAGSLSALLPGGEALKVALAWGRSREPETLSPAEANYLDALGAKAAVEKSRRDRLAFVGSSLALLIVATLFIYFIARENRIASLEKQKRILNMAFDALSSHTDDSPLPSDYFEKHLSGLPTTHVIPSGGGRGSLVCRLGGGEGNGQIPTLSGIRHNGKRVVSERLRLDSFNYVYYFENPRSPGDAPQRIWSNRFPEFLLQATYAQDLPPHLREAQGGGAALGTNVLMRPTFAGRDIIEDIQGLEPGSVEVDLEQPDDGPLRCVTRLTHPIADIRCVQTYPKPEVGRTTILVSLDLTIKKAYEAPRADSMRGAPEFLRKLTMCSVNSMYCSEEYYNADLIRVVSPGRDLSIDLRDEYPQGPHYFDFEEGEKFRELGPGDWFELVKRPGSLWFPRSPTVGIKVRAVRLPEAGRLAIGGEFYRAQPPERGPRNGTSHDRISIYDGIHVLIGWVEVPSRIRAGTTLGVDFEVIASAPEAASRDAMESEVAPRP